EGYWDWVKAVPLSLLLQAGYTTAPLRSTDSSMSAGCTPCGPSQTSRVAQGAVLGSEHRRLGDPAAQTARPHSAPAVLALVQRQDGVRRQPRPHGRGLGPAR